ncbi:hypothetical protein [Metapseudomonas furukawaii]
MSKMLEMRGVLPLSGYAWRDEETPADEYIGLAKWELESPRWSINNFGGSFSEKEKEILGLIEISGEDFRGLMEMSRLSVGNLIFYSELASRSAFKLNDQFWLHHLGAMTILSVASDRLRDVFVLGLFRKTAREYKDSPGGRNRGHYDHPFVTAMNAPENEQFKSSLSLLVNLAREIFEGGIDNRNNLIHELATGLGRLAKSTVKSNLHEIERASELEYDEIREAWDNAYLKHEKEIEEAVQSVVDWYRRLTSAASLIFDIEHTVRRSGQL